MTHPTAMARTKPSRPLKNALACLTLFPQNWHDVGCGRGADIAYLQGRGIQATGFDPNTFEFSIPSTDQFDVVSLFYVLNVIRDEDERLSIMDYCARRLSLNRDGRLFVATRADVLGAAARGNWARQGDGWLTNSGTFQANINDHKIRRYGLAVGLRAFNTFGSGFYGVVFHR